MVKVRLGIWVLPAILLTAGWLLLYHTINSHPADQTSFFIGIILVFAGMISFQALRMLRAVGQVRLWYVQRKQKAQRGTGEIEKDDEERYEQYR